LTTSTVTLSKKGTDGFTVHTQKKQFHFRIPVAAFVDECRLPSCFSVHCSSGERDKASEAERDAWFDVLSKACIQTGEEGAAGKSEGEKRLAPALLASQVSTLTSLLKKMVKEMTSLSQVWLQPCTLQRSYVCSTCRTDQAPSR
jgi:hypothetical protein